MTPDPGRMHVQVREDVPHPNFAVNYFEQLVGSEFPIDELGGTPTGTGRLVGAEVAAGGGAVLLTLDVPEPPTVPTRYPEATPWPS